MEKEVSATVKLGVALIMLALAMNIGFLIYRISSNKSMTITENARREEVTSLTNAKFSEYDATEISGSEVIDAIYKYSSNEMSVLVATQEWITHGYDEWRGNGAYTDYYKEHGLYAPYSKNLNGIPIAYVATTESNARALKGHNMSGSDLSKMVTTPDLNGMNSPLVFINYRALLGNANYSGYCISGRQIYYGGVMYYAPILYKNGDEFVCESGFITSGRIGDKLANNSFGSISSDYATEYIAETARYNSYLIKTKAGEVIGLAFIEQ